MLLLLLLLCCDFILSMRATRASGAGAVKGKTTAGNNWQIEDDAAEHSLSIVIVVVCVYNLPFCRVVLSSLVAFVGLTEHTVRRIEARVVRCCIRRRVAAAAAALLLLLRLLLQLNCASFFFFLLSF